MPKQISLGLVLVFLLAACKSVPTEAPAENKGDVVVSKGVAEYFEDDETEQLVAGQGNDIKCVRERRLGTHLVTRICRTKAEWKELYRKNQEMHRRRLCSDPASGAC